MAFTAKDVQALREMTGVGMMDCKKALTASEGDIDKAIEWLREKGLAAQTKKAGKVAAEGVSYAIVAIVDTNCDPDEIYYVIPGNDDAIRAIKLISSVMANAIQEGKQGKDEAPVETAETAE